MAITTEQLHALFLRCSNKIHRVAPQLNELDGRLGDGDLGATLEKCARLTEDALETQPDTPQALFQAAAMACTRASGSSFGTLLAVALLTAAKQTAGKDKLEDQDVAPLLHDILNALMARGGASLGDKTVLDTLHALAVSLEAEPDSQRWAQLAPVAVEQALDAFRQQPNKIGRARMFAERSVGMDDPGMVAFSHLVAAAVSPTTQTREVL